MTDPHTSPTLPPVDADVCEGNTGIATVMLAFGGSAAATVLGGLLTRPQLATWYAALNKPWYTPPNAVFPIAWNTLYVLMAFALLVYWQQPSARVGIIRLYFGQLVLNVAWSYVFFTHQQPLWGLVCLLVMWLLMWPVLLDFWRVQRTEGGWSGALFTPYAVWITYALALNAGIVALN